MLAFSLVRRTAFFSSLSSTLGLTLENMAFNYVNQKSLNIKRDVGQVHGLWTVYVVDLLSADGNPYHKSCFKCSHCKGTLVMSNYSSLDGVLYCKPHFELLFKESGNFSKNFQTAKTSEKQLDTSKTPNRLSATFSGTQDKCASCSKTVYPLEKVTLEGECFHKQCFKCAHSGCLLTHSSYAALNGVLYCKHHFQQLFMVKGDYTHVLDAVTKKNTSDQPQEADAQAETDPKDESKADEGESESKEEKEKGEADS